MLLAEWNKLDDVFFNDPLFHAFQEASESKDYASALSLLSELAASYPAHPGSHLHKGIVFESLAQFAEARYCYARVQAICSQHVKDLEEEDANQVPTWDTVVETVSGFLFSKLSHLNMLDHALFRTAVTFDKEHQRARCVAELEKAFKRRDSSVYLGARLALLYLDLNRGEDAKQTCNKCLATELYDAYADDWLTLSEVFVNLNMQAESGIAQDKAAQLNKQ